MPLKDITNALKSKVTKSKVDNRVVKEVMKGLTGATMGQDNFNKAFRTVKRKVKSGDIAGAKKYASNQRKEVRFGKPAFKKTKRRVIK